MNQIIKNLFFGTSLPKNLLRSNFAHPTTTTGFTSYNGNLSTDADGYPGLLAGCVKTTATGANLNFHNTSALFTPVAPSTTHFLRMWFKATTTSTNVNITLNWYNSAKSFISGSSLGAFTPTGDWEQKLLSAISPASSAYVDVQYDITGATTGDKLYWGAAKLCYKDSPWTPGVGL